MLLGSAQFLPGQVWISRRLGSSLIVLQPSIQFLTPSLLPSSSLTISCASGLPCGCLFLVFSYPTNSIYSLHQLAVLILPCECHQLIVSRMQYAGWTLHKDTAREGRQDFKSSQVICSVEGLSAWRKVPFPNHKQTVGEGRGGSVCIDTIRFCHLFLSCAFWKLLESCGFRLWYIGRQFTQNKAQLL